MSAREVLDGRRSWAVVQGDCLDVLKSMPEGSVQVCVTSPPYFGLRDYKLDPILWDADPGCVHEWGEEAGRTKTRPRPDHSKGRLAGYGRQGSALASGVDLSHGAFCTRCGGWAGSLGLEPTHDLYVEHLVQVFREIRRVLRPDGTAWLVIGDSYVGTTAQHKEGGSAGHNSITSKKTLSGIPTTGRKERVKALHEAGLQTKQMVGIPWRVAFALQADGWWLRIDIVWSKPNPMPESVRDCPSKSHEYIFVLTKSDRYYYDSDAIREPMIRGSAGSTFTDGKTEVNGLGRTSRKPRADNLAGRNKRSVWEIPTQPFPEAHFAVFPPALVEPCLKAGASEQGCCAGCGAPLERIVEKGEPPPEPDHRNPGKRLEPGQAGNVGAGNMGFRASKLSGQEMSKWKEDHPDRTVGWKPTCRCKGKGDPVACVVLDPFCGAGTTGLVARRLGLRFVGIELSEKYCKMSKRRVEKDAPLFNVEGG